MKKNEFNGHIYDFSVDDDAIDVDNILDIHKYSMKKMTYYKMFGLLKSVFLQQFGCNLSSVIQLKCISMNNQECKVRTRNC